MATYTTTMLTTIAIQTVYRLIVLNTEPTESKWAMLPANGKFRWTTLTPVGCLILSLSAQNEVDVKKKTHKEQTLFT